MAQLKQAVVKHPTAAVDAGDSTPITVKAPPGGPLTGEMCIRRGRHLTAAQLKKIKADAKKLIQKKKKHPYKTPKPKSDKHARLCPPLGV